MPAPCSQRKGDPKLPAGFCKVGKGLLTWDWFNRFKGFFMCPCVHAAVHPVLRTGRYINDLFEAWVPETSASCANRAYQKTRAQDSRVGQVCSTFPDHSAPRHARGSFVFGIASDVAVWFLTGQTGGSDVNWRPHTPPLPSAVPSVRRCRLNSQGSHKIASCQWMLGQVPEPCVRSFPLKEKVVTGALSPCWE